MTLKTRTAEQIEEHYQIEKELATKLRNASRDDRTILYNSVYDELFQRVKHHPQLIRKENREFQYSLVLHKLALLRKYLSSKTIFLEIGAGDCSLAFEVARYVKEVYAIEVSDNIAGIKNHPSNFKLIISDGLNVPLPKSSVDIAYSNQLMEHLHPEDAFEQLRNIYETLVGGGIYICITPNRISGPHDISRYFDDVPTGFHLREYTVTELADIFRKIGFVKINLYAGGKRIYIKFPICLVSLCEKLFGVLPGALRKKITHIFPFRTLLGIIMVGQK